MGKKRSLKRWKEVTWQALSKLKRMEGKCQKCGKVKDPRLLDAHHLIPRSKGNYAMFEPDNIVVMCGFYCHRNWWHGTSTWEEQRDIIERTIGLDRYFEIKRKSNQKCSYKEYDYEKMLEVFNGEIEKREKVLSSM